MHSINNLDKFPHVLILAGGLGSRSMDPKLPKILQKISDSANLLSHHIKMLEKQSFVNITLLLGYRADIVIDQLKILQRQYPNLKLNISLDEEPRYGTSRAISKAIKSFQSENYLLILGDIAIGANFLLMLNQWQQSGKQLGVCTHPNLHPEDSDIVVYNSESRSYDFIPKQATKRIYHGVPRAVAGAYFFTNHFFHSIRKTGIEFSQIMIQEAIERNEFYELLTSYYFKDSGTPSRLNQVRKDFNSGSMLRRSKSKRKAIFLDRDGTLVPNIGTSRNKIFEEEISSLVSQEIRRANVLGLPIFVVTNQPGIAKGEITEADFLKTQAEMEEIFRSKGAFIDDFRYCKHHPESGFEGEVLEYKIFCDCRKPQPGMFEDIAEKHDIDLSESYVIGDSEMDEGASRTINSKFLLANYSDGNSVAERISDAIYGCIT